MNVESRANFDCQLLSQLRRTFVNSDSYDHFGGHNLPSWPTIENWIKKFELTFPLKDERDPSWAQKIRHVTVRDSEPGTKSLVFCTLSTNFEKIIHFLAYKNQTGVTVAVYR